MNQTMRWPLFLFAVFTGCPAFASDEDGWVLKKDEDSVQVYVPDTSEREIRAVTTVQASLSSLVALIQDDKAATQWINRMKEFQNLEVISPREWYSYGVIAVPWPFKDKDIVTRNVTTQDSATRAVTITLTSEPAFIPEKSGRSRIQRSRSTWTFTPVANGQVAVEYVSFTELNELPVWMVESLLVQGVHTTLRDLRKTAVKADYQTARFAFIKES